jgi:hypothetical protein
MDKQHYQELEDRLTELEAIDHKIQVEWHQLHELEARDVVSGISGPALLSKQEAIRVRNRINELKEITKRVQGEMRVIAQKLREWDMNEK